MCGATFVVVLSDGSPCRSALAFTTAKSAVRFLPFLSFLLLWVARVVRSIVTAVRPLSVARGAFKAPVVDRRLAPCLMLVDSILKYW